MAKTLEDLTWLKGRPQSTATAEVSAALTEVAAFRQNGIVERAEPAAEVIVKLGDLFYVYPAATAATMFSA